VVLALFVSKGAAESGCSTVGEFNRFLEFCQACHGFGKK
jgi:hypothetical protein